MRQTGNREMSVRIKTTTTTIIVGRYFRATKSIDKTVEEKNKAREANEKEKNKNKKTASAASINGSQRGP